MKIKHHRKILLAIITVVSLIIGSITAVAIYQEATYDFIVNGIDRPEYLC